MCAADISELFALSARALSDKGGCRGRERNEEKESKREKRKRGRVSVYMCVSLYWEGERHDPEGETEGRNGGGGCEERRSDVDRAATGNPSAAEHSSPLGGRALPDCRREVAEVWPRS